LGIKKQLTIDKLKNYKKVPIGGQDTITAPQVDLQSITQNTFNKLNTQKQEEELNTDLNLEINAPTIVKPDTYISDNELNASSLFSLENLVGRENSDYINNAIDEFLPNFHIDPGEIIYGRKNSYENPTAAQAFYNGLMPGRDRDIADFAERVEFARANGINPLDTYIDSFMWGLGEALQFYGYWRMSGAFAKNLLIPALTRIGILSKSKRIAELGEGTEKVVNRLPKVLQQDAKKFLTDNKYRQQLIGTIGVESSIVTAVEDDIVDGILYTVGYPAAFKYGFIPGFKGFIDVAGKGLTKVVDKGKNLVIKSQTEDDIPKPLNKITSLIQKVLDGTQKDGIENLGTNTQKVIKELENISVEGQKNLGDLIKTSAALQNDVQKLLKVFNTKVVGIINNIGNTTATKNIKALLDSPDLKNGDFETLIKFTKLIANESKHGHKQNRKKFFVSVLDEADDMLSKFGNSDVATIVAPGKIPLTKDNSRILYSKIKTKLQDLVGHTKGQAADVDSTLRQALGFNTSQSPDAIFKNLLHKLQGKFANKVNKNSQTDLGTLLNLAKENPKGITKLIDNISALNDYKKFISNETFDNQSRNWKKLVYHIKNVQAVTGMTGVKRKINKILDTKRDYNKLFDVAGRKTSEVKIQKGKKGKTETVTIIEQEDRFGYKQDIARKQRLRQELGIPITRSVSLRQLLNRSQKGFTREEYDTALTLLRKEIEEAGLLPQDLSKELGRQLTRRNRIKRSAFNTRVRNDLASDEALDEIAQRFVDDIQIKAEMAKYGIDPSIVNRSSLDKLTKRKKRLRELHTDLNNQLFKSNTKIQTHINKIGSIVNKISNGKETLAMLNPFKNIQEINQGIKFVSRYQQGQSLEVGDGLANATKMFAAMEKNISNTIKSGAQNSNNLNKEFFRFMNDYLNEKNLNTPELRDVQEVIASVLTSGRTTAEIKTKARTGLYKTLVAHVYDDLPGIGHILQVRGKKEDAQFIKKLISGTKQDKIKGAYELTRRILTDEQLMMDVINKNTQTQTLFLLMKSIDNPKLKPVVKQILQANKTQTSVVDLLHNMAKQENATNKPSVSLTSTGDTRLVNEELQDATGGESGVIKRVYNYFFKEYQQIMRDSGFEPGVAIQKLASNAEQSYTREASKGGLIETTVLEVKQKLKNTLDEVNSGLAPGADKYTKDDIDNILVQLDRLASGDNGKAAATKIFNALPGPVQRYVGEYHSTLRKALERFNSKVDDINLMVEKGEVFPDTGINVPWKDLSLERVDPLDFYFPRFSNVEKMNIERFDVFATIKYADGHTQRVRVVNEAVDTLEDVHRKIIDHADVGLPPGAVSLNYNVSPTQPLLRSIDQYNPTSQAQQVVDDIENLFQVDYKTVKSALDKGGYNYQTFYNDAFIAGPTFAKQRTGFAANYDTDHLTVLNTYLMKESRYRNFIEPVIKHDALKRYMKDTPLVDKNGNTMTGTMDYVSHIVDNMLGRPQPATVMFNKLLQGIIKGGKLYKIPGISKDADVRSFIDANSTFNYYLQFAVDIPASLIQSTMAVTSVLPAAGRYAFSMQPMKDATNLLLRSLVKNDRVAKNPILKRVHKSFKNKLDKLDTQTKQKYDDLEQVFVDMNLEIDSAHAVHMADQYTAQFGVEASNFLKRSYHTIGNAVTYAFRKGDIIPRRLAATLAYENADAAFNNVAKKLNKAEVDWLAGPLNTEKVRSLLRQKGLTLNPLEEETMKLMVNSSNRQYTNTGRTYATKTQGAFYTKEKVGMQWKYKANRNFKKDLAKNFSEETNHKYNSANNTGFMNEGLLKNFNLYKKFAVKEFSRLVGYGKKGQYPALAASLLAYQQIAGSVGLPFARDLKQLLEWAYYGSEVIAKPKTEANPALLDMESNLRAYAADSPLRKYALFGLASTAGIDLTQSASVNMEGYFSPRTPINGFGDVVGNLVLGDTYRRMKSMFNRIANLKSQGNLYELGGETGLQKYIRGFEAAAPFIPMGEQAVDALQVINGMQPRDYSGRLMDVYGRQDELSQGNEAILKLLGFNTMDEVLYKQTSSLISGKTGKELREIDKIKRRHFVNDAFGLITDYINATNEGEVDAEEVDDIIEELSEIVTYFGGDKQLLNAMNYAFVTNNVPRDILKLKRGTAKQKQLIINNLDILLRQTNKGGQD